MAPQRLQKILARAGLCSRRKAEAFILSGRISVNGVTVTTLGARADPDKDRICLDGRPVVQQAAAYFLLHKPLHVITSMSDPEGRKTVAEYLPARDRGLFPVGRLDYDSEGLLLLTNDGELANALMHPRGEIGKRYRVWVRDKPRASGLAALERGVRLDDGLTAPAKVCAVGEDPLGTCLEITIHEGRNRQVRRMFEAIGHPVLRLVRTAIGPLELGDLQPGQVRPLSAAELTALRQAVAFGPTTKEDSG